jgi:putative two-component system response regulator
MKTIFIVDDNNVNLMTAEESLSDHYDVFTLLSATVMFELLENVSPDLILLDIMMPEINGFEALKKLKADERYASIPVIFLTSKNDAATEALGFESGVLDFISKPFSKPVLINRIKIHLAIAEIIRERTEELLKLQTSMFSVLAKMLEGRDKLTGGHVERTAEYIRILLRAIDKHCEYANEIKDWDLDVVISSARLHDLGKIFIADRILNKSDRLTADEYEAMKNHSAEGERIIDSVIAEAGNNIFFT